MATAVASGFGSVANTARWEVDIAQPHNIEVPRSLVDVVVSWNIPMHKWLKKCKYITSDMTDRVPKTWVLEVPWV